MTRTFADISMSLDGFVTGPNDSPELGLGEGGESLHEWILDLKSWREPHGLDGGREGPDDDVMKERFERAGAFVMGRRMFDHAEEPWGDEPPFHGPVFVVTHRARDPLPKEGGTTFTFVTEGYEKAMELAREAAGEKDVSIAGGASVIQQGMRTGLLDELQIHVTPILLGGGVRLLDGDLAGVELSKTRVIDSPAVTHLKFEVRR